MKIAYNNLIVTHKFDINLLHLLHYIAHAVH